MAVSNVAFWNAARAKDPTFAAHTSKGTEELFTERGWEMLQSTNPTAVSEFFNISIRTMFLDVKVADAKDLFAGSGLVQKYATSMAGFLQRMSIPTIKPITPKYTSDDVYNGNSVDMQKIRIPDSSERFFRMNFNYQSLLTLSDMRAKQIFTNMYGMEAYLAGFAKALRNGYTIQHSLNVKECLHAALTSEISPLQDTQEIELNSWTDNAVTEAEIKGLVRTVDDIVDAMTTTESTDAYNAYLFDSAIMGTGDLLMLIRPEYMNIIKTGIDPFNDDRFKFPIEHLKVNNFGGIYYTVEVESEDVQVYPYVDAFGTPIKGKYTTTAGTLLEGDPDYEEDDVTIHDPHEDVIAIIAQKGVIFEAEQNPYRVEVPPRNVAGQYQNYWANSPENGINYDPIYNLVVIKKPSED